MQCICLYEYFYILKPLKGRQDNMTDSNNKKQPNNKPGESEKQVPISEDSLGSTRIYNPTQPVPQPKAKKTDKPPVDSDKKR